jgi:cell division septation protein DedD
MPKNEDGQYEMVLENRQVLGIFFVVAVLCGVFFALGYIVGKNTGTGFPPQAQTAAPAAGPEGRRSALSPAQPPVQEPPAQIPETKPAETSVSPPVIEEKTPQVQVKETPAAAPAAPPQENFILLQVAALSKREDADAVVALLKKKNYPVTLVAPTSDKLFRVQVGPFATVKEAEASRVRLQGEGFQPIVKK